MPAELMATNKSMEFAEEVRAGLTQLRQKELPSKYLYDEVGSALFEVISVLPEYGLCRADERLLKSHADEIIGRIPAPIIVAELGSGSGKKTQWILEAVVRRENGVYCPIEISHSALALCERQLDHIDRVSILGFEAEYLDGLRQVVRRRKPGQHILVLFLGSSIGNFDRGPAEGFLDCIRRALVPGDALLLSTDLVKPIPRMIRAYDDAIGATAAFNLNMLARINRELDGEFILSQFQHSASYNSEERRIEMHLVSSHEQTVTIRKAELAVTFQKGETIWTESSYKYYREDVAEMGRRSGFKCEAQWIDEEWPFAQTLFVPKSTRPILAENGK